MKTDADMSAAGGGGSSSPTTPAGEKLKHIQYLNQWDPELVIPAANNIRYAGTLGLPELEMSPKVQADKCIIVGSGPSVLENIEVIREFWKDKRNAIFAVNEAHGFLAEHGMHPTAALVFEIAPRAYKFLTSPHPECTYYICSICDPGAFDALKDYKRVVWHCASDIWAHKKALLDCFGKFDEGGIEKGICKTEPMMVGGGFTTYLRTLNVAFVLGYRDYELFGFDSSYEGDSSHFFGTPDYGGEVMDCWVKIGPGPDDLTKFRSKAYLIRQADEFRTYCEHWHKDFKMRVHGRGLVPSLHRFMQPQFYGENNGRA